MRYIIGLAFAVCGWGLLTLGQPVWAVIPAAVSVYILGSVLWDALRGQ